MKNQFKHLISLSCLGSLLLGVSQFALAHGYTTEPPSRAYLCSVRNTTELKNTGCGNQVPYDPHSFEAPKGFPEAGPADGVIASAAIAAHSEMDEQSPTRWVKSELKTGKNTFAWYLTVVHSTDSWRYFITKPDWDPSQPLTRDSFDLTPFCVKYENGVRPPVVTEIECDVPKDCSGYHVILAVWDVYDTSNAFYQVSDVNISD